MKNLNSYFLPYQIRYLKDKSRRKIVKKSRRVGFTYVQSYEDLLDAARADGPMDVWFSSADQSAAFEYIQYVAKWARLFNIAAKDLGEVVLDKDKDIKAFVVELATGKRVSALSSNPTAFRSKGGKMVLDEYAFHARPEDLWKAAYPIMTWGFPGRILSTFNGKGNRYFRMVDQAEKLGEKSNWKLHTVTIIDAVNDGLADKIVGRPLTNLERQVWLDEVRDEVGEESWQQEYMCNPLDESTAWLPWELIVANESKEAGVPGKYLGGPCFVGRDVARRRDLAVIWVNEQVGDIFWTREVIQMKGKSFAEQDAEFDRVMNFYKVIRACIDQTGMGEKVVEDAQNKYGSKVEGVLFSGLSKQELAMTGKKIFEDRRSRIPADRSIRDSHHAVKKITTAAGNPRFDADRSEVGHADEFWAHMLSLHASENPPGPIEFQTVGEVRESFNLSDFTG